MPDISKQSGKRDRLILELLYASGVRVSELWQLDIESINLTTREIRVMGKGSKERIVLIGIPAAEAVQANMSIFSVIVLQTLQRAIHPSSA